MLCNEAANGGSAGSDIIASGFEMDTFNVSKQGRERERKKRKKYIYIKERETEKERNRKR